jgi:DNA-binding NtrC family response regulator
VLQEREVRPVGDEKSVKIDVRLIAATHRDLAAEVKAGRFREDLYYRLKVVELRVPPLRERPDDIQPLAEHFVRRFADRFGLGEVHLSERLLERLKSHPWPGNVRELENTVERLVALSTAPLIDDDPFEARPLASEADQPELPLKDRVAAFERGIILQTLEACHNNQSEAARRLGLNRVTLLDKLKRLGVR